MAAPLALLFHRGTRRVKIIRRVLSNNHPLVQPPADAYDAIRTAFVELTAPCPKQAGRFSGDIFPIESDGGQTPMATGATLRWGRLGPP